MARTAKAPAVSCCRMISLGINPVRGGKPPSDRMTSGNIIVRMGVLLHDAANALTAVTST